MASLNVYNYIINKNYGVGSLHQPAIWSHKPHPGGGLVVVQQLEGSSLTGWKARPGTPSPSPPSRTSASHNHHHQLTSITSSKSKRKAYTHKKEHENSRKRRLVAASNNLRMNDWYPGSCKLEAREATSQVSFHRLISFCLSVSISYKWLRPWFFNLL